MLILLGLIGLGGAACASSDPRPPPPRVPEDPPPASLEPDLLEVPDVIGEPAEDAATTLEEAGLEPTFAEEPEDPSLCEVSDQDETGEVEVGTEVILTLECEEDPFS